MLLGGVSVRKSASFRIQSCVRDRVPSSCVICDKTLRAFLPVRIVPLTYSFDKIVATTSDLRLREKESFYMLLTKLYLKM